MGEAHISAMSLVIAPLCTRSAKFSTTELLLAPLHLRALTSFGRKSSTMISRKWLCLIGLLCFCHQYYIVRFWCLVVCCKSNGPNLYRQSSFLSLKSIITINLVPVMVSFSRIVWATRLIFVLVVDGRIWVWWLHFCSIISAFVLVHVFSLVVEIRRNMVTDGRSQWLDVCFWRER